MPRGISKKAVHIKDTGSPFFEEAIFILKSGADGLSATDMASEAQRIVDNYTKKYCRKSASGKREKRIIYTLCLSIAALAAVIWIWWTLR